MAAAHREGFACGQAEVNDRLGGLVRVQPNHQRGPIEQPALSHERRVEQRAGLQAPPPEKWPGSRQLELIGFGGGQCEQWDPR